jgi:CelD/BcsL family acetyltransferase involved in cellulose biosynthesis
MLHFLLYRTGVKRVEVAHADKQYGQLASRLAKGVLVRTQPATSYMVDLDQARAAQGGYLSMLSANTRSQIRRSVAAYQALGPLSVTQAGTVDEAKAFLCRLKVLHELTWSGRGVLSGFANDPTAQRFHDGIVEQGLAAGEVQILRLNAGDTELGYLYNLVHRGRVIFYQSGFNYGLLDKHDRPGVVCHWLAIEHNLGAGHQLYDFAAGDYRYKQSLSTQHEAQGSHVFQRDGLLPRLDQRLRDWKRMAREWRARAAASS